MRDDYRDYKLLLANAAGLYEKHEAGRPAPFNVFSTLYKETDEVNLHSRFLHALLDYRKPGDGVRENLEDFLQHVAEKDFAQSGVTVKRESDYIDILITNAVGQAVVIENKIYAGDQPEQLQRYHKTLKNQGYRDIHLLYLTLHGHAPSEDSVGNLDYKLISYKDDLHPWLERCQQRAYDEPELRESVAQYRQLIRKLTGTDYTGVYMEALKKLCLQGNNLVLVNDLYEAMNGTIISLLKQLWDEIEEELKNEITDLPTKDEELSNISKERITDFVEKKKKYNWHGLYYGDEAEEIRLGVEVEDYIFFGVRFYQKDHRDKYDKLKEQLHKKIGGDKSSKWWPWYQWADGDLKLKNPDRKDIELLSNKEARQKFAKGIAQGLKRVWEALKEI